MNNSNNMMTVKNNSKNPATIFENIILMIYIIFFTIFTIIAILNKEFLLIFGGVCFVFPGIFFLYVNNRSLIYFNENEVIFRKYFKSYKYDLNNCEFNYYYDSRLKKYSFKFDNQNFSVSDMYLNINLFINTLQMAKNYFAREEGLEKLKDYFKQHYSKTDYRLNPVKDKKIDIFTSKIGGIPYWDFNKEYPKDENGEKMHLLCQLNFEDCPQFEKTDLPKQGILQFFISSNEEHLYGINFEEPTLQKNYRIIYHEKIDRNISEEDIIKIVPDESEITSTPILNPVALEFCPSISYMDIGDYQIHSAVRKAAHEITGEDYTDKNIYDIIGLESENINSTSFYRMISETESHVLGYPSFTQNDVRDEMSQKDASYFDTVLLHLDSNTNDGEAMCWGDCGCANFFINSQDLRNCNFSKILYTWDCY